MIRIEHPVKVKKGKRDSCYSFSVEKPIEIVWVSGSRDLGGGGGGGGWAGGWPLGKLCPNLTKKIF
jgi:hypothetical protein